MVLTGEETYRFDQWPDERAAKDTLNDWHRHDLDVC